jgi:hypothetical protein
MNKFSYKEYKKIISYYLNNLKITKLQNIKPNNKSFFFIRHDVEFSTLRALKMAKIENKELGVRANYFFHVKSNSYNLLSNKNIELVKQIQKLGHKIGLHFNYTGPNNKKYIKLELLTQISILKKYFKEVLIYYTPHRPSTIKSIQKHKGKKFINLYSKEYFTPFTEIKDDYSKPVFLSDSRRSWRYIHPLKLDLKKFRKVQLNFHPDVWSTSGLNNFRNYSNLINDSKKIFKQSLIDETDNLKKVIKL